MFPLTRPNRQAVATAVLLAFTVAPTAFVVVTAWRVNRPSHVRAVEAELGRTLGLQVSLGGVRYPRPGEVEYRRVVLRQAEPRRRGLVEVARAEVVRLRRGDREVMIEAEGLRVQGESPRQFLTQVGGVLQASAGGPYERVGLTAADCVLDLGSEVAPYQLSELACNFQADPVTPAVRASYRVTAGGSSTRCELTLTRDRKAEPVRTTLALRTMEGLPLPARVLDPFFDTAAWLGPDARFEGALTLKQEGAKDWGAEFSGHLLDIDLNEIVGKRFPDQKLRGKARLAVDSARWGERPGQQGFGWLEARGELTAGPGVIGLGLLQALSSEMKFRKTARVGRVAASGIVDLEYRALALGFAMTPDGEIRVTGGLGNEYAEGAVIAGPTDPLAFAPEGAAHVRGLIKTLFPVTSPDNPVMVPLTEKSRLLLWLPVGPDQPVRPRAIGGN